eukprot:COSAG02_NODE_6859_length_3324_cov_1.717519_3_plen_178_part_00
MDKLPSSVVIVIWVRGGRMHRGAIVHHYKVACLPLRSHTRQQEVQGILTFNRSRRFVVVESEDVLPRQADSNSPGARRPARCRWCHPVRRTAETPLPLNVSYIYREPVLANSSFLNVKTAHFRTMSCSSLARDSSTPSSTPPTLIVSMFFGVAHRTFRPLKGWTRTSGREWSPFPGT